MAHPNPNRVRLVVGHIQVVLGIELQCQMGVRWGQPIVRWGQPGARWVSDEVKQVSARVKWVPDGCQMGV